MRRIRFAEFPDILNYPRLKRAKMEKAHRQIIDVYTKETSSKGESFSDVETFAKAANYITAMIMNDIYIPESISSLTDAQNLILDTFGCRDYNIDELVANLPKDIVLDPHIIDYDETAEDITGGCLFCANHRVDEHEVLSKQDSDAPETTSETTIQEFSQLSDTYAVVDNGLKAEVLTPQHAVSLKHPAIPQIDYSKAPWISGVVNGEEYAIYESLPRIPTVQNEISVTTDPNLMRDRDFLNLFPNHVMHTRRPAMYEKVDGLYYDPDIGTILPIEGYTLEQCIDNVIQYPHLFQLKRFVKNEWVMFSSYIEINGELLPSVAAWNDIPDAKKIPAHPEYIYEYVLRRYLLERDIGKVYHKYDIWGTLDPFLTLFAPADWYAKHGYRDSLDIAKKCVDSRVSFLRSRNPIIRKIQGTEYPV